MKVNNLTKKFDNKYVLRQVNLEVIKGDVIGVVGPNGAGKTTLLRILAGLIKTSDIIQNIFIEGLKKSSMFEYQGFIQHLTCKQNISLVMYYLGISDNNLQDNYKSILGIGGFEDIKYRKISLGMKSRLAIYVSLLQKSDFYIFDEPFNGLDSEVSESVMEILKNLKEESSIIVSSHDFDKIEPICNHFVFLRNGEVKANLSKAEIQQNYGGLQGAYNAINFLKADR